MDRKEVEAMLTASEPGSDTFLAATDKLTRRTLGELCRTWMAVRDAPAVRVTGSGHSWEGGGKTTLVIDGDHHVELLRTYRIVPDPVTAYGEVK